MENGNKRIARGQRVPCPSQLTGITNLKRYDDADSGTMEAGELTSTMDCCAPASGYPSATTGNQLIPGLDRIIPCRRDGYTRV